MFVICSMMQERQATLLCMSNYKMKTFTQVVMKMDTELEVGCVPRMKLVICCAKTPQHRKRKKEGGQHMYPRMDTITFRVQTTVPDSGPTGGW